jgi:outer membrane beta-barrel protein
MRAARLTFAALCLHACWISVGGRVAAAAEAPDPAEQAVPLEQEGAEEAAPPTAGRVSCLDELSDDGYRRKGVQKRDFIKRLKLELSGVGGFYASDVLSSTYTYGGALAFFPAEDFGLEVMVTRSKVEFRLEEPFAAFDRMRRFEGGNAWQAMGALLFSPFHAKFKLTEATIVHGDLFLVGGAGRTFHDSVQGLTWQAGFGLRLYLFSRMSFRLDVRDLVLPQEVLGRGRITNNVTVLGGLCFWFG